VTLLVEQALFRQVYERCKGRSHMRWTDIVGPALSRTSVVLCFSRFQRMSRVSAATYSPSKPAVCFSFASSIQLAMMVLACALPFLKYNSSEGGS